MYRIALVEDEKYNADRFCDILKAYAQKENVEFQIQWYRDALTFLEEYAEGVDIVFMDIRMPVMDGIQATEKIRTISLTVPIIAVTAYAFYTEQQQAIQAGCNAVISKPYSLERLRETIESYIG